MFKSDKQRRFVMNMFSRGSNKFANDNDLVTIYRGTTDSQLEDMLKSGVLRGATTQREDKRVAKASGGIYRSKPLFGFGGDANIGTLAFTLSPSYAAEYARLTAREGEGEFGRVQRERNEKDMNNVTFERKSGNPIIIEAEVPYSMFKSYGQSKFLLDYHSNEDEPRSVHSVDEIGLRYLPASYIKKIHTLSKSDWDDRNSPLFSSHPQSIGSIWVGDEYVYGPRLQSPSKFKSFKTIAAPKGIKDLKGIKGISKIKDQLPRGSKLIIGKLHSGDEGWGVQSTLIPKKIKLGKSLIRDNKFSDDNFLEDAKAAARFRVKELGEDAESVEIIGGYKRSPNEVHKDIDIGVRVKNLSNLRGKEFWGDEIDGIPLDMHIEDDSGRKLISYQISPQMVKLISEKDIKKYKR